MRRIGDLAIQRNFLRAGGGDAAREFGVARGEHQRQEAVREQVADDAGVVIVKLVPTEVALRGPRHLLGFALPHFPIEVAGVG